MRASDVGYDGIVKMLISGELKCGQPVDDKELMEKLQIGKTPLREALTRLTQDSFVNTIPHRGMSFTNLNIAEFNCLLELRISLMGYLAKRLIYNITDEQIETLEEKHFIQIEDPYVRDHIYHKLLGSYSNDKYFSDMLYKVETLCMITLRSLYGIHRNEDNEITVTKYGIIDALKERDEQKLRNCLETHIPKYVLKTLQ